MTTQDAPIEHGHDDASREAKITGLLAQVRADHLLGSSDDAAALLRQRLADAGIEVDDTELAALTTRVTK